MFNVSTVKVGGLRFIKIGRFCFSFCVTSDYKAFQKGHDNGTSI